MNALDNLDARRWVNKMCIAADVPLIESGTTGFLGQVQPIKRGVTECYDCVEKTTPKTYPVCTIRSTPSTPIHCIVWAKSWLFTQLFGADDETEEEELDKAVADGEDAKEIDSLRKEAREMRDIWASLVEAAGKEGEGEVRKVAERIFDKVYRRDIERLLGMEEMWTHRPVKPVPLVFKDAINGVSPVTATSDTPQDAATSSSSAPEAVSQAEASKLKDQRTLSLAENVELFLSSITSLASRSASNPTTPLSFDKDDSDALDFVTSSSNLRSLVYHIPQKSRFDVKQMAGNIIPAIASTNAIIAGMLVIQALHALSGHWERTRMVSLQRGDRFLSSWEPSKPNPNCGVCQDVYVPVEVQSLKGVTLGEVVEKVVREGMRVGEETEIVVYDGSRILADPDFEENLEKSLGEMGLKEGSILTVMDEEQELQAVNIVISLANSTEGEGERVKVLVSQLEAPKLRAAKGASGEEKEDDSDDDEEVAIVDPAQLPVKPTVGKKRPHPEEEETAAKEEEGMVGETPEKKRRTQAVADGSAADAALEID